MGQLQLNIFASLCLIFRCIINAIPWLELLKVLYSHYLTPFLECYLYRCPKNKNLYLPKVQQTILGFRHLNKHVLRIRISSYISSPFSTMKHERGMRGLNMKRVMQNNLIVVPKSKPKWHNIWIATTMLVIKYISYHFDKTTNYPKNNYIALSIQRHLISQCTQHQSIYDLTVFNPNPKNPY